mgnify:FL=1|jgi:hypothetical protein
MNNNDFPQPWDQVEFTDTEYPEYGIIRGCVECGMKDDKGFYVRSTVKGIGCCLYPVTKDKWTKCDGKITRRYKLDDATKKSIEL